MVNPAILADFAAALGLKPRSNPISLPEAKKAVSELYRPRRAKIPRKAAIRSGTTRS